MAQLLPPLIEGTLPAFCNGEIKIPFTMNQGISWTEIVGFKLKIKNIYTNKTLKVLSAQATNDVLKEHVVTFIENKNETEANKLSPGNYYKVQLAYVDNEKTIGYYSTVGVIKYTTKPLLNLEISNDHKICTGKYSQSQQGGDTQEKIYSYRFIIYNSKWQIHEDSGECIHEHENDRDTHITIDEYKIKRELNASQVYYVKYIVTTLNGFQTETKIIIDGMNMVKTTELDGLKLTAEPDRENGYIELFLKGKENTLKGKFLLSRSDSSSDFLEWTDLARIVFHGTQNSEFYFKDFVVASGKQYKYALQQYNDCKIYSDKIYSNQVEMFFEHMFLYDGQKQLKIKYNPKVSSFKDTLLEQKTNTLGNKYPYFFRNAQVKYKEFQISGLISYMMDEKQLFLSNEEMGLVSCETLPRHSSIAERQRNLEKIKEHKIRTTNLVDYNLEAERIFKLKVLDFLNNGKPKLFKSPAEGNYIVRLMNSSLTPDDKMSRMLHTFNTTATEVADFTSKNLFDLKLLTYQEQIYNQPKVTTMVMSQNDIQTYKDTNQIISISCKDINPGAKLFIGNKQDNKNIQIGITGNYEAIFENPIEGFSLEGVTQGQVDYLFYDNNKSKFDDYLSVEDASVALKQYIGPISTTEDFIYQDLIKQNENENEQQIYEIKEYLYLFFSKRPIDIIDTENNVTNKNQLFIYYDQNNKNFYEYNNTNNTNPFTQITNNEISYKFTIDNEEIDLEHIQFYELRPNQTNYIPKISLGNGVALDIAVARKRIKIKSEVKNNE